MMETQKSKADEVNRQTRDKERYEQSSSAAEHEVLHPEDGGGKRANVDDVDKEAGVAERDKKL